MTGGQLVPESAVDGLRADVAAGRLNTWPDVHAQYDRWWQAYPREKQRHALAILNALCGAEKIGAEAWDRALLEAVRIQEMIRDQVYQTRKKDFESPFRRITFRNDAEMAATIGDAEQNDFVLQIREDTEEFRRSVQAVRARSEQR